MTIAQWLFDAMIKLGEAKVDSPRRDALVLLEDTLQKERSWVLAHHDFILSQKSLDAVNELVRRRCRRVPLAYIRGKAWFYGRFFEVNEHVLIPRPESESIIECVKKLQPTSLIDVGTGSGCLAITCALELPDCTVLATDVSKEALEVARTNVYKHGVKVEVHETYLLEGLLDQQSPDVVIANLPYVPEHLITSPEIMAEPHLALFAGENGLDVYQSFWAQLGTLHHAPKHIITESLETQHTHMQHFAEQVGYRLEMTDVLVQQFSKH